MPEDLSLILNDSTLFSASAEITTKEILKRYGDRTKVPSSTQAGGDSVPPQSLTPKSRESRGSAPVVTRVDTDPELSPCIRTIVPRAKEVPPVKEMATVIAGMTGQDLWV